MKALLHHHHHLPLHQHFESVDVVEDDDDEEEADKMKPVSPVVDKEIRNTLIQQEAACIVIDDN